MILKGGSESFRFFCYGNEASDRYACMNGHLPTANQSEIREAYLNSVPVERWYDISLNLQDIFYTLS